MVLRDLYRAGYEGVILGPAYAVNRKLLDALPHEVTQDVRTYAPSPDVNSSAYKRVQAIHGTDDVDPYTTQVYDHANLMLLAAAAAGEAEGTAMRDAMRSISQGEGEAVDNAVDGIRLLSEGRPINYAGAERALRLQRDRRHLDGHVPLRPGEPGTVRAHEGRLARLRLGPTRHVRSRPTSREPVARHAGSSLVPPSHETALQT